MKKKEIAADIIVTLIFMMLLYASFSKYFDFDGFQRAMHNQPFPAWLSDLLIILLPPVEIITAGLLVADKTRQTGLIATLVLMSMFSIYIIAIFLHLFPRVPCSCGGIIRLLTWNQHLIFNLFFIVIAFIALKFKSKKQGHLTVIKRSSP